MKQFKRSPIAIVCYVFAAIVAVYFVAVTVSTLSTIHEYYAQYGMKAGFGETMGYLLQNGLDPLVKAITVFMAGFILEEVRKLNPANWMTAEERAEAREAKQLVKEQKLAAKGEAAKIKAGVVTAAEAAQAKAEASVEANFVEDAQAAEEVTEAAEAEAEEVTEEAAEVTESVEEVAEETGEAAEEVLEDSAEAAEAAAEEQE